MESADWVFPAEPRSVSQARLALAETVRELPDEHVEIAVLLTTELVMNAVLHGAGPVRVHAAWGEGSVRVEVDDQSAQLPVLGEMDRTASSGRGLRLVDGLSSAWGVSPRETGKTVWFTL
jgi:anti-sigma regulatory factor (Ser/Thr protein kinase)